MAKTKEDINHIEMEFESKLLALENEVLQESFPRPAVMPIVSSSRNPPGPHISIQMPFIGASNTVVPSSPIVKQIPRILRKSSVTSSSRVPMCPIPSNASPVLSNGGSLSIDPTSFNSEGIPMRGRPPIKTNQEAKAQMPIKLIPIQPNGAKCTEGIKYLVPRNEGGSPSESIRLLIPSNNPLASPGNVISVLKKGVENSSSSSSSSSRSVKIVVKGTNTMRVVGTKIGFRPISSAAPSSFVPVSTMSTSSKTKIIRVNPGNITLRTTTGNEASFTTMPILPKGQSLLRNNSNTNFKVTPIIQGTPTSVINSSKSSEIRIDSYSSVLRDTTPPSVKDSSQREDPLIVSHPCELTPPESQSEKSSVKPQDSNEKSSFCTRRDMLTKLHSKKRRIHDSILSKNSLQFLDPKVYDELFKRFFIVLKKIIELRKLIRKYEGSSAPIPSYLGSTESPDHRSYEEELQKEVHLFQINGIARFFHLSNPSHDFLIVMLSALESRISGLFFCRSCFSKFKDFLDYIRHLIAKHPVLLRCIYCGDVFISALELKDHIKLTSHGYCRPCELVFNEHEKYFSHVKTHHLTSSIQPSVVQGDKLLVADTLKYRWNIVDHLRKYHPDNNCYVCSTSSCKLSFDSQDKLFEHFAANHIALICRFCSKASVQSKEFIYCSELEFFAHCKLEGHVFCPVCDVLFPNVNVLQSHMTGVHSASLENPRKKTLMDVYPQVLKYVRCRACGYNSINVREVQKHILSMSTMTAHSGSSTEHLVSQHKKLICSECNTILLEGKECVHHGSRPNGVIASLSSNEGPYSQVVKISIDKIKENALRRVDKKNNKKFVYSMTRADFIKKIIRPSNEDNSAKMLRCLTCRCAFASQEELSNHVDEVHKEYSCKDCKFVTRGKKVLSQHIELTHPIKIDSLSASFSTYNCRVCPNHPAFLDKNTLTAHIFKNSKTHYIYICQVCLIIFPSPECRNDHIRSSHLAKICHLCSHENDNLHVFPTKYLLLDHYKERHSEDLICDSCPPIQLCSSFSLSESVKENDDEGLEPVDRVEENPCRIPLKKTNSDDGSSSGFPFNFPPLFISTVNHQALQHDESPESQKGTFLPSVCGLCPKGVNYDSFEKLLDHVRDDHPSIVVCDQCMDLPIFPAKEDLFRHYKLFDHYSCQYCRKGVENDSSFEDWNQFQFHLKDRHLIIFCWNCETTTKSLADHRSICSNCDAVHCLPSLNNSHICVQKNIDLKSKSSNCVSFNTSRQKSLERYITNINSPNPLVSAPKLRLLLQHIFKQVYSLSSFYDVRVTSDLVTIEDAIAILQMATNAPHPDEYLVKLWRDFLSLSPSKFFQPPVRVKMEIDVDPSQISEEENSHELLHEDVVIKEEIIEEPHEEEEELDGFHEPMNMGLFVKADLDALTIEDNNPLENGSLDDDDEDKEDDSALLEDIEDILESTQKIPELENIKSDSFNSSPPVSVPRRKRGRPKKNPVLVTQLANASPESTDQPSTKRSLRLARRSNEPKVAEPTKRKNEGTQRTLRKRTKTS